jgi:phosphatidylserine/phosphatidylglycerophosphate/cardiolipin synthase-like enzyme
VFDDIRETLKKVGLPHGTTPGPLAQLWIAMWAFEDQFPIEYNPGPGPRAAKLYIKNFIRRLLTDNPELNVYILLWNGQRPVGSTTGSGTGSSGNVFGDPAPLWEHLPDDPDDPGLTKPKWFTKREPRVHVAWQSNWITGSQHQKFVIASWWTGETRDSVLWCMGTNFEVQYWDLPPHTDPKEILSPSGPTKLWHDSGIKVKGGEQEVFKPFEEEFKRRWNDAVKLSVLQPRLITNQKYFPAQKAGNVLALPKIKEDAAILVATGIPKNPIKEWYLTAISAATSYIYFENQYLDDTDITRALIKRFLELESKGTTLRAVIILPEHVDPSLLQGATDRNIFSLRLSTANTLHGTFNSKAVVAIRPVGGCTVFNTPAGGPTAVQGNGIVTKFDKWTRVDGGIRVYTMKAKKKTGAEDEIYVHSKAALIDDQYTIGSYNLAIQSARDDSEANVLVSDIAEVTRLQGFLWPPLIGAGANMPQTVTDWFTAFDAAAETPSATSLLRNYPISLP